MENAEKGEAGWEENAVENVRGSTECYGSCLVQCISHFDM